MQRVVELTEQLSTSNATRERYRIELDSLRDQYHLSSSYLDAHHESVVRELEHDDFSLKEENARLSGHIAELEETLANKQTQADKSTTQSLREQAERPQLL